MIGTGARLLGTVADTTVDPAWLTAEADARGLTFYELGRLAGVDRKTMLKIRRRQRVTPSVKAKLDRALERTPRLQHVQIVAATGIAAQPQPESEAV